MTPVGTPSGAVRRSFYRFYRWMYRGGRPNRVARVLNRISAVQFSSGLILPDRTATLEVVGQRTGRPTAVPLVIADLGAERYLVSMLGESASWVRNLRAADGRAVLRHRRREAVLLEEVPAGARAPILRRYLAVAPGARPHIPVERHASLAELERVAARLPVFRVIPLSPTSSDAGQEVPPDPTRPAPA